MKMRDSSRERRGRKEEEVFLKNWKEGRKSQKIGKGGKGKNKVLKWADESREMIITLRIELEKKKTTRKGCEKVTDEMR